MDETPLPHDLQTAHAMIAALRSRVEDGDRTIQQQATELHRKNTELSLKDNLIEEQAHSVLELKADADKLDEKVTELNLMIEKLLKQLYGRRSERRLDGKGQLFLNFGEAPTPEVISALGEAIREARQIVDEAEEAKKQRRRRPKRSLIR